MFTLAFDVSRLQGYALITVTGCVQVLAANQSPAQKKWFQGTADAVRQYLWLFENSMREGIEDFLILAGKPLPNHPVDMLYCLCNLQNKPRGSHLCSLRGPVACKNWF